MINPDIYRGYLIDDAGRQGQCRERNQYGQWREQAEAARRQRPSRSRWSGTCSGTPFDGIRTLPERDVGIATRRDL